MSNYIVTDTELTSIANTIRTKGGTNGNLTFPNGFNSAINNISGGGSSDFSKATLTIIVDSNTSGEGVPVGTGFYLGEDEKSTYIEEYFYVAESDTEVEADFILNASGETEITFGNEVSVTIVSSSGDISVDISVGKHIYLSGDATIHITINGMS